MLLFGSGGGGSYYYIIIIIAVVLFRISFAKNTIIINTNHLKFKFII